MGLSRAVSNGASSTDANRSSARRVAKVLAFDLAVRQFVKWQLDVLQHDPSDDEARAGCGWGAGTEEFQIALWHLCRLGSFFSFRVRQIWLDPGQGLFDVPGIL